MPSPTHSARGSRHILKPSVHVLFLLSDKFCLKFMYEASLFFSFRLSRVIFCHCIISVIQNNQCPCGLTWRDWKAHIHTQITNTKPFVCFRERENNNNNNIELIQSSNFVTHNHCKLKCQGNQGNSKQMWD